MAAAAAAAWGGGGGGGACWCSTVSTKTVRSTWWGHGAPGGSGRPDDAADGQLTQYDCPIVLGVGAESYREVGLLLGRLGLLL